MEQIKTALTSLEQAVLKLESAVYTAKKNHTQVTEQVGELKGVVKTAYDRLNKAIDAYRQGGE